MAQCNNCGASLKPGATRCVKCGTAIESIAPPAPQPQSGPATPAPTPPPQVIYVPQPPKRTSCDKNKVLAGILAIVFGGIGVHKFYLGRIGQGILYLLFFWTYVPAVVGFVEGIVYLCMSDESFCRKFGRK